MRRRANIQPLITEPGSFELEFNGIFSPWGTNAYPLTFRFSPVGESILWGRSEFSATMGYDSGFADHLTLAMTSVIADKEHIDIAAGPQFDLRTRGAGSNAVGGFAIIRGDFGRSSAGITTSWLSGNTLDSGVGLGQRLGGTPWLNRLTAHANYNFERSNTLAVLHTIIEGVECEVNEKLAFDLSAQHLVYNGTLDHQILLGVTLHLGGKH